MYPGCVVWWPNGSDGDLGSWKRAVTTADGTWQTVCQKGRLLRVVEGYAAPTFQRAKEEVAIHC